MPARIVEEASTHLGKPYVFGGRDGRSGCRRGKRRVRCPRGIDCQSLIFFSLERVTGRPWTQYSVMPSVSVTSGELGQKVPGLDGVLREKLDVRRLQVGDVVFFLFDGYNLEADDPLWRDGDREYGVWHMGLVHSTSPNSANIIHAKPGDRVKVDALDAIDFDALFVVRPA